MGALLLFSSGRPRVGSVMAGGEQRCEMDGECRNKAMACGCLRVPCGFIPHCYIAWRGDGFSTHPLGSSSACASCSSPQLISPGASPTVAFENAYF